MEDEHLFIQQCLKKHNVSVSQLAERAGIADSTLYEFTGGRRKNVPIDVWRALFELTEDVAVVGLVTGNVETFVVPMPRARADDASGDALKTLMEKRQMDLKCEMAILEILADGKINKDDFKAVEKYKGAHPETLKLDSQIFKIIIGAYEEATSKK